MKHLLALLFLLISCVAGQAACAVPYTFVNGQIADAGQVNANFAAVVNCSNTSSYPTSIPNNTALANYNIGGLAQAPVAATSPVGYRNRVINGDFAVWQRGVGPYNSSVGCTTACTYSADRWLINGTGALFVAAQTAPPVGSNFQYGVTIAGAASNTSAYVAQRIEARNIYDLAGSGASLQVQGYCSTAQTIQWAIYYPTATDNYAAESLMTSGTFSFGTTIGAFASQVVLSSFAANGAELRLYPQNGGAFVSGTCTFTGVQLEVGSYPTPFERLPYQTELTLAQRYYQALYCFVGGYGVTGSTLYNSLTLSVAMRATPSVAFGTPIYSNTSALATTIATPSFFTSQATVVATGTVWAQSSVFFTAEL